MNVAYYGTCGLARAKCPVCKDMSFVMDGEFTCCGLKTISTSEGKFKFKVISASSRKRRLPSLPYQRAMLEVTGNRCVYCGHTFGNFAFRKGRATALRLHWDHFVPFALSQANPDCNFLAACHICNSIKSSLIFETLKDARAFIKHRALKKGYSYGEEGENMSWLPTPNLSDQEEQAILLRQMQVQELGEPTS